MTGMTDPLCGFCLRFNFLNKTCIDSKCELIKGDKKTNFNMIFFTGQFCTWKISGKSCEYISVFGQTKTS